MKAATGTASTSARCTARSPRRGAHPLIFAQTTLPSLRDAAAEAGGGITADSPRGAEV